MHVFKQTFMALVAVAVALMFAFGAAAQTNPPERLNDQQLEQLLAPIALYPDPLLAQVLTASTYPLEVVQANRWVKAHPAVKGAALEDAMQLQAWDPSVKGLTAAPQVLAMMDQNLEWTQQLGDAFLAQPDDIARSVQVLRERARAAGKLLTTPQQVVTTTIVEQQPIIYIVPANPEIVYVPVYDPFIIYGPWPYPAYPPYYWYPPGYVTRSTIWFGAGLVIGRIIWGDFDWRARRVTINVDRYNRFNRTRIDNPVWTHDPVHRRAVPYRDPVVRQRYDRGSLPNLDQRRDFRGRTEPPTRPTQPTLRPPTQPTQPTLRPPTQPTQPTLRPPVRPTQPSVQRQNIPAPKAYDGIGRGQDIRRESVRGTESLRSARQPAQTNKPAQPVQPAKPSQPAKPAQPTQPNLRQR